MRQGLKTVKVRAAWARADARSDFTLLIDYALTPSACRAFDNAGAPVTKAPHLHVRRRRQSPKVRRFEMGEVSGNLADLSVITADNSRYENVLDILADIKVRPCKDRRQIP